MGNAAAIPFIGETVTVAESVCKTVAAGACAVVGESDSAKKLIKGAGKSWENYSEVNAIAANVHMAVAEISGDKDKVKKLQDRQRDAWSDIGENTPIVGHVAGVVNYAVGNSEAGDRCMIGATRTAAVIGAGIATGGAGAVAVGTAAMTTGAVYDGVATGLNSAAKGKYAPTGHAAGVTHAIKTGDPNSYFDAAAAVVMDGVGAKTGKKAGKTIKAKKARKNTPAKDLADQPGRLSHVERYTPHEVVSGAQKQVPFERLQQHPQTKNLVKMFDSPDACMRSLCENTKYDVVRLQDGSMRFISHQNRIVACRALGGDLPVGHSSLLPLGGKVVAAGEIHVGPGGVITNINAQSGHFQVPLKRFKKQIGKAMPSEVVTFQSPTFTTLLNNRPRHATALKIAKSVGETALVATAYGLILCGPTPSFVQDFSDWQSQCFTVAWHQCDQVHAIAYQDKSTANKAFESLGSAYAKVVFSNSSANVLSSHGVDVFVKLCIDMCLMYANNEGEKLWNPNAMCGEYLAKDRAIWLVDNKQMTGAEAMFRVMEEFPDQFCLGSIRTTT